jgi:hypothetical protein
VNVQGSADTAPPCIFARRWGSLSLLSVFLMRALPQGRHVQVEAISSRFSQSKNLLMADADVGGDADAIRVVSAHCKEAAQRNT